jgi:hypothetical protein
VKKLAFFGVILTFLGTGGVNAGFGSELGFRLTVGCCAILELNFPKNSSDSSRGIFTSELRLDKFIIKSSNSAFAAIDFDKETQQTRFFPKTAPN